MAEKIDKPTLVIGASPKPERYSNMAVESLLKYGHTVYALAKRNNIIYGVDIANEPQALNNIHTVTMYLRDYGQRELQDYILSLHPKRIIFNPGAENSELEGMAKAKGIEVNNACTLVMLSTNHY
ncbi:MAG: CoA-binding protein [Bacteroidia bacterium]|nr:CoA-binding protein [Bacteroidia bacterium]